MSNNKKQLDNLLNTYNLTRMVSFPTRIDNTSISMIDNIFIDSRRNYTIKPQINGLSDHDAQLITINNFFVPIINADPHYTRIINNIIADFQIHLSWEKWDNIFGNNNVNTIFNNFLNTYLRHYHSSIIKKETKPISTNKLWLTKGIRVSCQRKNFLYYVDRTIT